MIKEIYLEPTYGVHNYTECSSPGSPARSTGRSQWRQTLKWSNGCRKQCPQSWTLLDANHCDIF